MAAYTTQLEVDTRGRGFNDISAAVQAAVGQSGVDVGLCQLFIRHTSASLLVTENADPDVRRDLETFMSRVAPDGDPAWVHSLEGPDDMPAHIRSVLTCSDLSIPVRKGRLGLGTWQGVYLWEHRARPHRRRVDVTVLG
ncbi:MAG: secondary thiamine-phosphate synthase enzyme YjbQ [Xanthomonadales bacterium]|jgi:secondary thiamine-phosphate synthase enzyme